MGARKPVPHMTVMGAGPKILAVALPYAAVTIALGYVARPLFKMWLVPYSILLIVGISLIAVGLAINVTSARRMMQAFAEKKLLTDGTFGFSRNPMYASFIFFTIPGLALALNNGLFLTTSVVLYLAVRMTVRKEEAYLEALFGREYTEYCRRVGLLMPRFKG